MLEAIVSRSIKDRIIRKSSIPLSQSNLPSLKSGCKTSYKQTTPHLESVFLSESLEEKFVAHIVLELLFAKTSYNGVFYRDY